jgi:hypothetical protein
MSKIVLKTMCLISFWFFPIFTGICKINELKKSPIIGTWIEKSKKSDTLIFLSEYDIQNPIFQLKRGFNPIDKKNKVPKSISGPYWYKLERNSILIKWFLSSDANFHSYYFLLSENKLKLKICDFFNDNRSQKDTLTFIKEK